MFLVDISEVRYLNSTQLAFRGNVNNLPINFIQICRNYTNIALYLLYIYFYLHTYALIDKQSTDSVNIQYLKRFFIVR